MKTSSTRATASRHLVTALCVLLVVLSFNFAGILGGEKPSAFSRAVSHRRFQFPRDHGSHPEFKTEWWYLTGVLENGAGDVFGYQATWFRSALLASPPQRRSNLGTRDVFFFHAALTDTANGKFVFDQAASRGASTWAGAEEGRLRVFVLGRQLEAARDGSWRMRFNLKGRRFDLRLTPQQDPLLHGEVPGLSLKGQERGQASHYVSLTRLRTEGKVQTEPGGEPEVVTGQTWFDHEFGSDQLGTDRVGWDWFSVALDDGTDLMLYLIRKRDGSMEPMSSGTLRFADGERVHLEKENFSVDVSKQWTSPKSGGQYPARWSLRVPDYGIELDVRPMLADQELDTRSTTGIIYWEGLCQFSGKVRGHRAKGKGYVELVGYAGDFRAGI